MDEKEDHISQGDELEAIARIGMRERKMFREHLAEERKQSSRKFFIVHKDDIFTGPFPSEDTAREWTDTPTFGHYVVCEKE